MHIKTNLLRAFLSSTSMLALAGFSLIDGAKAQGVWEGDVDNDWNNAANWDDNNVPDGATSVVINGAGDAPVLDNTLVVAKDVTVGDGTGAGQLTLENSGLVTAAGGDLVIGDPAGVNAGGVGISGIASFISVGGALTINGADSGSSRLLIHDGAALEVNGGPITIGDGAALQFLGEAGTLVGAGVTDIAVNGALQFGHDSGTVTITHDLSGSGVIDVLSGTGRAILSGDNSAFSGVYHVHSGELLAGDANALGGAGGEAALIVDDGRLLTGFATRFSSLSGEGGVIDLALGADLYINQGTDTTYAGVIEGGGLIKSGGGVLTLTGANTYGGGTTISAGALQGNTMSLQGDILNDATLIFDQATDGTYAGAISGTGALHKLGDGTLILTGVNTYTGGTSIKAGALQGDTFSLTGDIANEAVLVFDQATDGAYAGVISGGGSMVKTGAGVLALTGANSFTGGAHIKEGALGVTTDNLAGDVVNDAVFAFDQGFDGVFLGDISGSGVLIKTGAGRLRLAGENSYTGGTVINGGTLQGDTTSLVGDITNNNAALLISQETDGTWAGRLSGTGAFTKEGAGAVTLTGDSSGFVGTSVLSEGALLVDGELGGALDVLDGTLKGTGAVGIATIAAGARVAPGNSIGALNVVDVTFSSGSVYEVEVNSAGESDIIKATGAALLNGGAVDVIPFPDIAINTTYTILTAAGGVTGIFDGAAWPSDSLFLSPVLSYDAENVYLAITQTVDFSDVALTPNQTTAAGGAQSLGGGALFTAIGLLGDADEARAAFDAVSGEIHAHVKTALLEDSRFVREGALAALGDVENEKPFTAWARGFGGWGHWDSDGNAARLARNLGGLMLGGDAAVSQKFRLGVFAGYSQANLDAAARASSADVQSWHLGAYGGARSGAWGLRFGGAWSGHDIDTARGASFAGFSDSLSAEYDARALQTFGEAGYRLEYGKANLEPFAGVSYVNLHTDGFTEGGGDAALTASRQSTDAVFTTLGFHGDAPLSKSIALTGTLGWRHAFGDTPASRHSLPAGGDAFAIAGAPLAEDALALDVGLSAQLAPNATLGLSYNGQFGSGASDNSARGALSVSF